MFCKSVHDTKSGQPPFVHQSQPFDKSFFLQKISFSNKYSSLLLRFVEPE